MNTHPTPSTAQSLVIVDSPATAITMAKFLGPNFIVEASFGQISTTPSSPRGVDFFDELQLHSELTPRGAKVVARLKALLADCEALYLATDHGPEGGALAWQLFTHLEPKVPVYRMVFNEIAKDAVLSALAGAREVSRARSGARVQSSVIRLLVQRERQRIGFVPASWWGLSATTTTLPAISAQLSAIDHLRVTREGDFDSAGLVYSAAAALTETQAMQLREALDGEALIVCAVNHRPYRSHPQPPFSTATLLIEATARLGVSPLQVMRLAQELYEWGYITFTHTDSTALSAEAQTAVWEMATATYGSELVSEQPRRYLNRINDAKETDQAIRPSLPLRTPEQLAWEIRPPQALDLYRLIWQRTLASQMIEANGSSITVRLAASCALPEGPVDVEFVASGIHIVEPGYRRVMPVDDIESNDDSVMPSFTVGERIGVRELIAQGHHTTAPARYTDASLLRALDEFRIGRPGIWAPVIGTIQDRGYAVKRGSVLIPTWSAIAKTQLLEAQYRELVDSDFTASAQGEPAELNHFILGIDPAVNIEVFVKHGVYGPTVWRGDRRAAVPDTLAPDELTLEFAIALLNGPPWSPGRRG
jgi:DNA topoisomerase I